MDGWMIDGMELCGKIIIVESVGHAKSKHKDRICELLKRKHCGYACDSYIWQRMVKVSDIKISPENKHRVVITINEPLSTVLDYDESDILIQTRRFYEEGQFSIDDLADGTIKLVNTRTIPSPKTLLVSDSLYTIVSYLQSHDIMTYYVEHSKLDNRFSVCSNVKELEYCVRDLHRTGRLSIGIITRYYPQIECAPLMHYDKNRGLVMSNEGRRYDSIRTDSKGIMKIVSDVLIPVAVNTVEKVVGKEAVHPDKRKKIKEREKNSFSQ